MAPLKYEEQLKDKLEKRQLNPSENAWDKLSKRLDKENKNTKINPFWWLGLAASLVGVMLIASQFLNTKIPDENNEIVTVPEVEVNEAPNKNKDVETLTTSGITLPESQDKVKNLEVIKKQDVIKPVEGAAFNETKVTVSNEIFDDYNSMTNEQIVKSLVNSKTFEEQKIEDVVAQVNLLKESNKEITDADIDVLLQQAQQEIKLHRLVNETVTDVVDASKLLQDVEAELDQSFRSKVFEAIKSSYNSVKTAVAQRNQ